MYWGNDTITQAVMKHTDEYGKVTYMKQQEPIINMIKITLNYAPILDVFLYFHHGPQGCILRVRQFITGSHMHDTP